MDELMSQQEFDKGNIKEYKIQAIWNNAVYAKKLGDHLPGLYYLALWKGNPEEENSLEPALTIKHL